MSITALPDNIIEVIKPYRDQTLRKSYYITDELIKNLDKEALIILLGTKVVEALEEVNGR